MRIFRHSGDQKVHRVGVDSAQKRGSEKDAREDFANDGWLADTLAEASENGAEQDHGRERGQDMEDEVDLRAGYGLGRFWRAFCDGFKLQVGRDGLDSKYHADTEGEEREVAQDSKNAGAFGRWRGGQGRTLAAG